MSDETGPPPNSPYSDSTELPPPNDQRIPPRQLPEEPFPQLPGYQIVRKLGRGGQADVYEAIQESTSNRVAVKVMRRSKGSERAVNRLLQEMLVLAQSHHPNIVSIVDAGKTSDGRLFIVMEYVRGEDLRSFVKDKRPSLFRILEIFRLICEAVDELHKRGIVHRDLKPKNVLIDEGGRSKVLDMGLAVPLSIPRTPTEAANLGSLPYMSPEQTQDDMDAITIRSDVYALGAVLYELLTGEYPYPITGSRSEDFETIRFQPPSDPRKAWGRATTYVPNVEGKCPVGGELEAIINRALAKDPHDRFSSAGEFARAIDDYQRSKPISWWSDRPWFPLYVAGTHARKWIQRHRVSSFLLAVLLGWGITETAGVAAVYRSPLHKVHYLVLGLLEEQSFKHVCVIGQMSSTNYEALAKDGIPGVSTDKPGFKRPVHGKLMKKLASSGCSVVVWDFTFDGESEFDTAFVEGVKELSLVDPPIETIVGVGDWWLDHPTDPGVIATFVEHVGCGMIFLETAKTPNSLRPWSCPLLVQSKDLPAEPALSVAVVAAHFCSFGGPEYNLDRDERSARIRFTQQCLNSRMNLPPGDTLTFPLTEIVETTALEIGKSARTNPLRTLEEGDLRGNYWFLVPPDDLLKPIPYEKVLSMSPEDLRAAFRDKVVLIGNLDEEQGIDHFTYHPDGRDVFGCYGHAAAIEGLIRGTFFLYPSQFAERFITLGVALVGTLTAVFRIRRMAPWMVWLGLTVSFGVISVLAYLQGRWLWDPLPAVFAIWIGGGLGTLVLQFWRSSRFDLSYQ